MRITIAQTTITSRELIAAILTIVSFCGSLAFGYGVKAQQAQELAAVVARHDVAIISLTSELMNLRIAVAELNATISRGPK